MVSGLPPPPLTIFQWTFRVFRESDLFPTVVYSLIAQDRTRVPLNPIDVVIQDGEPKMAAVQKY